MTNAPEMNKVKRRIRGIIEESDLKTEEARAVVNEMFDEPEEQEHEAVNEFKEVLKDLDQPRREASKIAVWIHGRILGEKLTVDEVDEMFHHLNRAWKLKKKQLFEGGDE